MSDQDDNTRKEQLLQERIIKAGLDPDEFEKYLYTFAPDKESLFDWSFFDLQLSIMNYEKELKKQSQLNEVLPHIKQKPLEVQSVIQQSQVLAELSIDDIITEEFSKTIGCKTEKYFIEKDANLTFKITALEKQSKFYNFLYTSEQKYQIVTFPFGWKITRKASEFLSLMSIIKECHSEIMVREEEVNNAVQAENQINQLQKLLQIYNIQKKVRTQKVCYLFLCENQTQHHSFQKEIELIRAQNNFSLPNKQSKDGKLEVNLTKETFNQFLHLRDYPNNTLKHIEHTLKQFNETMSLLAEAQNSITSTCANFAMLQEYIPFQDIKENTKQNQFQIIRILTQYQRIMNETNSIIGTTILKVLNEMKSFCSALFNNIQNCLKVKEDYQKKYKQFIQTKESLLQEKFVQDILRENKQLKFTNISSKVSSLPNIDYERLCVILGGISPLKVPVEFNEQEEKKLEFSFLIQETYKEAKEEYVKELSYITQVIKDGLEALMQQQNNNVLLYQINQGNILLYFQKINRSNFYYDQSILPFFE